MNARFFAAVSAAQLLRSGLQPAGCGSPSHLRNPASPLSAPTPEPSSTWITSSGSGGNRALLAAVEEAARAAGCKRLWLITTNDNLAALRFYQRRGYALVAVHRAALDGARQLKPGIPLVGRSGVPLRDELELEKRLYSMTPSAAGKPPGPCS